jgi:2-succinyl-6-hydroxy-2,4-cyclohexadiene-1-carboxylate synthase
LCFCGGFNGESVYIKLGDENTPLYYQVWGEDDGKRPPVIFVNGWCLSERYWYTTAEAISKQYPCLTYDSRGFGRSNAQNLSPKYAATIDSCTDELVALVKKLGWWEQKRAFHVVGHSLGAVVAVHFAAIAQNQAQLASLTIINSGSFDENEPQGSRLNTFVKIFVQVKGLFDLPFIRQSVISRSVARSIPVEYERLIVQDIARSDKQSALELSLSSLEMENLRRYRREILATTFPVLLIVGDKDATIPPKGMYNIKRFKPQSSFVAFPDCGHLPMLEQPKRFVEILLKHFSHAPASLKN